MSDVMRVDEVSIQGYRALKDIRLPLGGLNVLIGPNGSGKSAFLDVWQLLSEMIQPGLRRALSVRGGLGRVLTADGTGALRLSLVASAATWGAGKSISYAIHIVPAAGGGHEVVHEQLDLAGTPGGQGMLLRDGARGNLARLGGAVGMDADRSEAMLGLTQWTMSPEALEFQRFLGSTRVHTPVPLDERSPLRLPQTLQPGLLTPSPSGEDLLSALQHLRTEHEPHYERLMDVIRAAFPTFRKLEFPAVAAGQITLAWHTTTFSRPFYINELSAGTLRFLLLAALLLSPSPPPLVLLDEPEISLHPEMLRLLAELLIEASDRTQIVAATHSAALIRWLRPEHIVVVESEDGVSRMTRGDALALDDWLEKYTLDQLWQMGEMGDGREDRGIRGGRYRTSRGKAPEAFSR